MQSTENKIYLLPALPDAWQSGTVKGICARGGFELSFEWKNKTLTKVEVFAKSDGKTSLINGKKQKAIALKKGQRMAIHW
jgi:alpha-L-fucosidase 2